MITSLLFVFLFWLPIATVVQAIIFASPSTYFTHWWKKAIYVALAAPSLYANWLIALLAKNQTIVEKLSKLGDWFKS